MSKRRWGSKETYIAHRQKQQEAYERHVKYMADRDALEEKVQTVSLLFLKRLEQFLNGKAFIQVHKLHGGDVHIRLKVEADEG